MNKKDLPIGFYDSGVGGLNVLYETEKLLPHENFIYYGDLLHAPYGEKSEEEILQLSLMAGEFLFEKGVKAIVIACNTATSIAVNLMREKYRFPVISIEPAVKPAVEKYADGDILVLATPATLGQKRYKSLKDRLAANSRVTDISCGGLAELVEGGAQSGVVRQYLAEKFAPFKNREVQGIVVGCTHYSFISGEIYNTAKEYFSGPCEIFDGKNGTARHIKWVLEREGLLSGRSEKGTLRFYASGEGDASGKMEAYYRRIREADPFWRG
ncbi:MAG: glutamate racemase [Christensenellaceae bacterium]|jgi:glutamate racemase